jgi:hypothetical protein
LQNNLINDGKKFDFNYKSKFPLFASIMVKSKAENHVADRVRDVRTVVIKLLGEGFNMKSSNV